MRVKNPAFVNAGQALAASKKAAVQAFLATAPEFVTLEDIRGAMPAADRPALTDGVLCQILQDLGLRVEQ